MYKDSGLVSHEVSSKSNYAIPLLQCHFVRTSPVNTQRRNNVVSTSPRHQYVAAMSKRHYYDVVCLVDGFIWFHLFFIRCNEKYVLRDRGLFWEYPLMFPHHKAVEVIYTPIPLQFPFSIGFHPGVTYTAHIADPMTEPAQGCQGHFSSGVRR